MTHLKLLSHTSTCLSSPLILYVFPQMASTKCYIDPVCLHRAIVVDFNLPQPNVMLI